MLFIVNLCFSEVKAMESDSEEEETVVIGSEPVHNR